MPDSFTLDPRLASDTAPLGSLALSRMLLMDERRFPWVILVPRRNGLVELFDLPSEDRRTLIEETAAVASALKRATGLEKINIGALGNVVRQLHVHVVARKTGDPAWPNPVWGFAPPRQSYPPAERDALILKLARELPMLGRGSAP